MEFFAKEISSLFSVSVMFREIARSSSDTEANLSEAESRSEEIREALQEPLSSILESIRITLERCPPELSADLVDRGLVMAGGGALLRGIDRLVAGETGLPVHIADDPLSAVAEGTGRVLQELQFLKQVTANSKI